MSCKGFWKNSDTCAQVSTRLYSFIYTCLQLFTTRFHSLITQFHLFLPVYHPSHLISIKDQNYKNISLLAFKAVNWQLQDFKKALLNRKFSYFYTLFKTFLLLITGLKAIFDLKKIFYCCGLRPLSKMITGLEAIFDLRVFFFTDLKVF